MSRRELLKSAGLAMGVSQLQGEPRGEVAAVDWLKTCRALICEAYNPPFYPSFDYQADKAVGIATALNADSMRYPAASYFAYFPTKSGYPVHPELQGDPFRETVDLCQKNGMRVVAYVPLNHPFMDASSKDPRYAGWSKKFADGTPMTTEHYGFAKYFEGCLNSPVREVIRTLVREVLTGYPVDAMYFDGPYQGMNNAKEFCHCKYCEAAYRTYEVPHQSGLMPQLMASRDTVLLHLIADTGNKTKKLRIREEFLPVLDVKVRVRVPDGRVVRGVSLMRAGMQVATKMAAAARGGWVEVTVPRVLIHEAVRVDLA